MNLLIGCDPEVFVHDGTRLISAHGLIPGTKEAPFVVSKGGLQVDGMALEFNTNPAANVDDFIHNISEVMADLEGMIRPRKLVVSATANFDTDVMDKAPPEAKMLGCTPDFNAYTETKNPSPKAHHCMRTAGGHIHLGWTNHADIYSPEHFTTCLELVKQLDFTLGLPSVIMDGDVERKKMYGAAGAFRPKPYGVEYRSLSNFWIANTGLMNWAYHNTELGFDLLINQGVRLATKYGNLVQEIINSNDVEAAKKICDDEGIPYITKENAAQWYKEIILNRSNPDEDLLDEEFDDIDPEEVENFSDEEDGDF